MEYDVKALTDKIYLLIFKDRYDLCMFFLRYQEYYESPNPAFCGKQFQILDFMEWYAKSKDGVFSYPKDWAGFNIPSNVIDEVFALGIIDKNIYDYEMMLLHRKLKEKSKGDNYYLIGVSSDGKKKDVETTVLHELAHAMYHTIREYKNEMDHLVDRLPKKIRKTMNAFFEESGYAEKVWIDETQAYLSTGFEKEFPAKHIQGFIEVFDRYRK